MSPDERPCRPAEVATTLAFGGTRVAYWMLRGTRAAFADDFRGAFPELSPSEIDALTLRTYHSYSSDVLDLFRSVLMPREQALELFEDCGGTAARSCRRARAARASSSSAATSATGRSAAR